MAETTKHRNKQWENWVRFCMPLGVDPCLGSRTTEFITKVRTLSGFPARTRSGYFDRGKQVSLATVCPALTAVDQAIKMDKGTNPLKQTITGSTNLLPRLQLSMSRWNKEDPPTTKKLPVADIPELFATMGTASDFTAKENRVCDLALIAFYYLPRVGKYAVTGTKESEKQTTQFRVNDVRFFRRNKLGQLRQLP